MGIAAERLDLGAEQEGGAGRHGDRIHAHRFTGAAKATGKRDTGKVEIAKRSTRTTGFGALEGR
jgi:hypothetical protein